jgi:hypothetical protein
MRLGQREREPTEPESPDRQPVIGWVEAALASARLNSSQVTIAALDLDGIHDSVKAIAALIQKTLRSEPTLDNWEDLAVELQVQMEHIDEHWRSLFSIPALGFVYEED